MIHVLLTWCRFGNDLLPPITTAAASPGTSPSPSGSTFWTGLTFVGLLPLLAAAVAAAAVLTAAVLQYRIGRRTVTAALKSAEAATDSVVQSASNNNRTQERADAEALARRYQDASGQLGDSSAAIRLAGVYAMSRLADDWEAQRQTCVSVLCAYLRIPPNPADVGEAQVRRTVQSEIERHLQVDAHPDWSALSFDFSGAVWQDVTMQGLHFQRAVDFSRGTFLGRCRFGGLVLEDGAEFGAASVSADGELTVSVLSLQAGTLSFSGSLPLGSVLKVFVETLAEHAQVRCRQLDVAGVLSFILHRQRIPVGRITLWSPFISAGGKVTVDTVSPAVEAAGLFPRLRIPGVRGPATDPQQSQDAMAEISLSRDLITDGVVEFDAAAMIQAGVATIEVDPLPF